LAAEGVETRRESSRPPAARPLGVGVLLNPALHRFVDEHLDAVDYVALIPDSCWIDRGIGMPARHEELEDAMAVVDSLAGRIPLVAHSTGLSIGSAKGFDVGHVAQIARWHKRYDFAWHSDHLAFVRVAGVGAHDVHAGLAVPVPYDEEVLALLIERVRTIREAVATPFLLENNVFYVDLPEQDMTEPKFLNRLAAESGCGLLLDVHNVYTNARNHGFDAAAFIAELDLDHVVEVHIAGGSELFGVYVDSHSGACPEPVWELLAQVVAGSPNLCGVTFEFDDTSWPLLRTDGLLAELDRARTAWARRPCP
jgi:uncharacterized protein (UPF0276 family)